MRAARGGPRRYHWLSDGLAGGWACFLDAPHAAIEGRGHGEIVNLADRRAVASRKGQLDLLAKLGPDGIAGELAALDHATPPSPPPAQARLPHLAMPAHHEGTASPLLPPPLPPPPPPPP